MAVINYYSESDLMSAIQTAKCCLAKKQSAQVIREANLMGRSSELECDTNFLISAIYLLESYVWEGEHNQITENEENELIQRVNTMCECNPAELYEVPPQGDCEDFEPICVQAVGSEDFPTITAYPDITCVYPIGIVLSGSEVTNLFTLSYNLEDKLWELVYVSSGEILDTSPSIDGEYEFAETEEGITSLIISEGACD